MADAGITLEIATERLSLYLAAETKVLRNQSYEMGDRKLTRADLAEIRRGITFWQSQIDDLGGTRLRPRGRVRRGVYGCR